MVCAVYNGAETNELDLSMPRCCGNLTFFAFLYFSTHPTIPTITHTTTTINVVAPCATCVIIVCDLKICRVEFVLLSAISISSTLFISLKGPGSEMRLTFHDVTLNTMTSSNETFDFFMWEPGMRNSLVSKEQGCLTFMTPLNLSTRSFPYGHFMLPGVSSINNTHQVSFVRTAVMRPGVILVFVKKQYDTMPRCRWCKHELSVPSRMGVRGGQR